MNSSSNKDVVERFLLRATTIRIMMWYAAVWRQTMMIIGATDASSAEEAVEILKSAHEAFPDMEIVVDELIEEGELVAFRGHFSGTHQGEFISIPASGAEVKFEALEIFKVIDGKITESWGYWPNSEILEQLNGKN